MTSPGSESGSARAGAYADLLAAVLAARSDPATARFDAEIAAAEAAGQLDGATARNLRWWQRESVRGLGDHLSVVLPGLLVALIDAERAADQSVADSAASWAAATGAGSPRGPGDGSGPDGGGGGRDPQGSGDGPEASAILAPVTSITPHLAPGSTSEAAPTTPTTPDPPDLLGPSTTPADLGAPRQRLLVAGLTVLTEGARPGDTSAPHIR
jgi:hypothetical protein